MNHDRAAGPRSHTACTFLVCRAGVGDVKRQMELAVRILCIDDVVAFGRFVIALNLLGAYRD